MTENKKIQKIAFLGGADWKKEDLVFKDAYETAKLLAEKDYQIINGGGSGVMLASTLGAHDGGAKALGITYHPPTPKKNFEGICDENTFDEEIITHDYFDRTKELLQKSDVHIVFKGGTGTISEFGMTWASSRIHEGHNKPIILFGEFWHEIIKAFEKHMYLREDEPKLVDIVSTPEQVLKKLVEWEEFIHPRALA
jgi:uncharacterized protein (TIGR00725 family)